MSKMGSRLWGKRFPHGRPADIAPPALMISGLGAVPGLAAPSGSRRPNALSAWDFELSVALRGTESH